MALELALRLPGLLADFAQVAAAAAMALKLGILVDSIVGSLVGSTVGHSCLDRPFAVSRSLGL